MREYAKGWVAAFGTLATTLLATGNLFVQNVDTTWPVIAGILTTISVVAVPNKTSYKSTPKR